MSRSPMKENTMSHLSEAEEALADFDRWRSSINGGTTRTEEKLAGALRGLLSTMPGIADAWDEGHKARRRRGPSGCKCGAWSSGECACGKYGNGELLSLKTNPYRNLVRITGVSVAGSPGVSGKGEGTQHE